MSALEQAEGCLRMAQTYLDTDEPDQARLVCNAGLKVVMLCTTEGAALSDEEQSELRRFVTEQGGTAIVSAFSNWSRDNHYNEGLVGWLGVDVQPRAQFGEAHVHTIKMSPPCMPGVLGTLFAQAGRNGCCAWGDVDTFVNKGETMFSLRPDARSIALTRHAETMHTLVFFPRELGPQDIEEGEEEQLPAPEPEPEPEAAAAPGAARVSRPGAPGCR
jgi:hypothetical protein